jgi:hypothetical protein
MIFEKKKPNEVHNNGVDLGTKWISNQFSPSLLPPPNPTY